MEWEAVIRDHLYEDQIFSTPRGQPSNPTFDEIIDLPPGTHLVEIVLYELPNNFDTALLEDDDIAASQRILSASGEIKID